VKPQQLLDLVYRAGLDEYGGARRLQLVSEWLASVDEAAAGR
jgi:hypothetical protein